MVMIMNFTKNIENNENISVLSLLPVKWIVYTVYIICYYKMHLFSSVVIHVVVIRRCCVEWFSNVCGNVFKTWPLLWFSVPAFRHHPKVAVKDDRNILQDITHFNITKSQQNLQIISQLWFSHSVSIFHLSL